jgi:DNA modification methylase
MFKHGEVSMSSLQIVYRNPAALIPSPLNPRTHSKTQITKIAKSIERFSFNNPVLLDEAHYIIAGHGRVEAAIKIGMDEVPTVTLHHLNDDQKRAYIIADNRLAEDAGWDTERLKMNFEALLEADIDFDLSDTGFEIPEIDALMAKPPEEADPADEIDPLDAIPKVARRGDLWGLGNSLIFCGDALDPVSYRILLDGERAEMVFTDAPYNVPIAGNVSGLGKNQHRDFAMATGEMSPAEFTLFLRRAVEQIVGVSKDGAIHYLCMDWRHLHELLSAIESLYSEFKNLCVWVKANGGMGSLYRSQHELVLVMKVGQGRHINNIQLGKHGRNRSNVWSYPGMSSFQKDRDETLALHPTVKPLKIVSDAIYDCSSQGGIILDPFGGSGTTLLAAEQTGRRGRLIEIDPRYVDVTIYRFMKAMGLPAINLATGVQIQPLPEWISSASDRGRSRHG